MEMKQILNSEMKKKLSVNRYSTYELIKGS